MKLLVLGGTVFLGRQFVIDALAAGHEVTLFNRGRSNPELFPELEKIRGDRDGGLTVIGALADRHWDAVIDPSGYLPRVVGDSARILADRVGHYIFISSISVYADFHPSGDGSGLRENSPVGTLGDPATETIDGETYGPLKALCEQVVTETLPGRALVIRPGLIVGPHDPTDRFSYWPLRMQRGGRVLAPGHSNAPVQIIDVRDLSAWILRMVEDGTTGTFNATGPAERMSFGDMLAACVSPDAPESELVWVDEEFLLAEKVAPFMDLPCWLPRESEGMMSADVSHALAAGLSFRPTVETAADILAWRLPEIDESPLKAGLEPVREAELLKAWLAAGR